MHIMHEMIDQNSIVGGKFGEEYRSIQFDILERKL
jgi:hypothetical protein